MGGRKLRQIKGPASPVCLPGELPHPLPEDAGSLSRPRNSSYFNQTRLCRVVETLQSRRHGQERPRQAAAADGRAPCGGGVANDARRLRAAHAQQPCHRLAQVDGGDQSEEAHAAQRWRLGERARKSASDGRAVAGPRRGIGGGASRARGDRAAASPHRRAT
jgi:hypothetical protein